MSRWFASVFLIVSGCNIGLADTTDSVMRGYVGFSQPIAGAWVEVTRLNADGQLDRSLGVATGVSESDGTFEIDLDGFHGPVQVSAGSGTTFEYWSSTPLQFRNRPHSAAVIPYWRAGQQRQVTITPWTTLAAQLGKARYQNGRDSSYEWSAMEANRLVYEHIIGPPLLDDVDRPSCYLDLTCMRPADIVNGEYSYDTANPANEETVLYAVSLFSLSALAIQRHRNHPSFDEQGCGTVVTLRDLLTDVRDDGLLDGNTQAKTTVETLRADLVDAAAREYWDSDHNQSPITTGELGSHFCQMAENREPELFGSAEPAGLAWLCDSSSTARR